MKFDPRVKVENNKLYEISSNKEIDTQNIDFINIADIKEDTFFSSKTALTAVNVGWADVEMEPGSYNEELLANLRNYLKKVEEAGSYAFIVAKAGKELTDADEADTFIKAMVHTARRIKDAESVVGFSLADELVEKDEGGEFDENSYSQWFINDMNVKHGHYVYFAKQDLLKIKGLLGKGICSNLVLF